MSLGLLCTPITTSERKVRDYCVVTWARHRLGFLEKLKELRSQLALEM